MLAQFVIQKHCYLGQTNLLSLHLISNLLIAFSYYSIAATLFYFVKKRDLPYASTLISGMFIVFCGTANIIEIWTFWQPIYWFGLLKAMTALMSSYIAIAIFKIVAQVELPNQSELQLANNKLEQVSQEQKQAEIDLHNERVFVEAMLDNLSDGIVACDRHGVLSLFNQAARNFHGLPSQAIPPEQWSEHYNLYCADGKTLMPKESIPLYRAFAGETLKNVEMMIVPKQGQPRILFARGNPIIDRHGQKIGAIAIMQDVTERNQAQLALHKSESIIKSFYDSAPMMMGIVELLDQEDFCHHADNNMAAKFFGLTSETMKGKQTSELDVPHEVRRRLHAACLQSQNTNQAVQFEASYKIEQNIKHFFLIVATIADKSAAGLPLFSYIAQDISDRKQMEIVLQESEECFRLAFEDAATGMAMASLSGDFLNVNRSLCEIVGFSKTELINCNFKLITHPDDLETDYQYLDRLLGGEIRTCQFQKRYIHKQGQTVWILLNVSLVRNIRGQPEYFIAQIQDITDRKVAEMELTKSLKEKEVMLQEIHHRVKNNLQVICSLLNLQSRYLKEEKTVKAFKETQNRVKSMALVHEQLYQSSNLSEIVLSDYIKQLTVNLFRAYSISSDIKCNLEVEDFNLDLDTAVPCGLIINEIITNAIKYAFDSTPKAEILIQATSDEENNLVLMIEDNGIGLKPDYDLETSKSLGLRLVKNLTEQLQGNYKITTEPNIGTKFEFTFNRIKK